MKKFLVLALVLILCLGTLSVCAFAADDANYVAEVNGTKYTDVSSAWDAVKEGGSISMLADWNISSSLEVPEDVEITINMNGHMINRGLVSGLVSGYSPYGYAILVEENAKLTLNGGDKSVVHQGYLNEQLGAWVYAKSGVFGTAHDIYGGLITGGCNNSYGGGIILEDDAKLTLIDVTIAGNITEDYGAGIYMEDSNEVVMERSHIIYNHANTDGGGIFMDENYCKVTGDNVSSISNNTAVSWGGGIYADGVYGGEISKVIIQNNSAKKGGGVLVDNDSTVLLKDITITNNTATESGAGVFCEAYGVCAAHIDLDGRIIIKDNFKGTSQNNIMLETARARSASYSELSITEDSEIGFGAVINKIRIVVSWVGIYDENDCGSKVFMDHDAGWEYAIQTAELKNSLDQTQYNVTVKLLSDWNASGGNFNSNADDGFAGGAIYVPEDVVITLDMDGYTIHRHIEYEGFDNEVILVHGTLYLMNGRIVGGYSNNGGGGIHIDGGKAVLNCVEVTSNRTFDDDGAGIHVINGTLEAIDCNIHHNTAYEDSNGAQGGGIYANNSTVNLTGTVVVSNTTRTFPNVGLNLIKTCEGGGIYAVDSYVTLTDCKVSGNYAQTAGTEIYAKGSTIDIIGGGVDRDWMMVVESTINFIGDPDSGEATQSEVVGSVFGGGSVIAIIIAAVVIAGAVIIAVKAKKKNKTKE